MKRIKMQVRVGAEKPFEILHITDTHLIDADERDCERKIELAKNRKLVFPHTEEVFADICALASEKRIPIVHTGDLMDFVSVKNFACCVELVEYFTHFHNFSQNYAWISLF
jgi:hypothetical protein